MDEKMGWLMDRVLVWTMEIEMDEKMAYLRVPKMGWQISQQLGGKMGWATVFVLVQMMATLMVGTKVDMRV